MKRQEDGRYKTKVVVGTRADGTKVIKWITGKTKRELQEKRQAVLVKYRDGSAAAPQDVMAVEWIYRWFDTVAAPGISKDVAAQKRRRIVNYIEPFLKDKQLRAVSAFDLQDIINACDKGHTVMTQLVSILKRSFQAAYANGFIPRDVSTALISRPRPYRSRRALTDEESVIIDKSLANRTTEPLMLGLFYYTGMRRGEVLGLQWRDIDFNAGIIHVRRSHDFNRGVGKLKTPAAERDIPIGNELMEILKENRGIGNTFVVQAVISGNALSESSFKNKWRNVENLLGTKEITPHYFRHNYATRLYDAGVDVLTASKVLGHADPTTTLKIYTDIQNSRKVRENEESVRAAFEKK